jgi:hypothetical protein
LWLLATTVAWRERLEGQPMTERSGRISSRSIQFPTWEFSLQKKYLAMLPPYSNGQMVDVIVIVLLRGSHLQS